MYCIHNECQAFNSCEAKESADQCLMHRYFLERIGPENDPKTLLTTGHKAGYLKEPKKGMRLQFQA